MEAEARGGRRVVEARGGRPVEEGQGAGGARRWRRRGPAAHRGGGAGAMQGRRRRRTAKVRPGRGSESRRRQPDGVSSAIRSPEARRFVCWIWPRMAKSRALGAFFLTFGTGLCHQPVPKVHWYRL